MSLRAKIAVLCGFLSELPLNLQILPALLRKGLDKNHVSDKISFISSGAPRRKGGAIFRIIPNGLTGSELRISLASTRLQQDLL